MELLKLLLNLISSAFQWFQAIITAISNFRFLSLNIKFLFSKLSSFVLKRNLALLQEALPGLFAFMWAGWSSALGLSGVQYQGCSLDIRLTWKAAFLTTLRTWKRWFLGVFGKNSNFTRLLHSLLKIRLVFWPCFRIVLQDLYVNCRGLKCWSRFWNFWL